jgi:hypothetical protein
VVCSPCPRLRMQLWRGPVRTKQADLLGVDFVGSICEGHQAPADRRWWGPRWCNGCLWRVLRRGPSLGGGATRRCPLGAQRPDMQVRRRSFFNFRVIFTAAWCVWTPDPATKGHVANAMRVRGADGRRRRCISTSTSILHTGRDGRRTTEVGVGGRGGTEY